MFRKLVSTIFALAAVCAACAPGVASAASPALTHPTGTLLAAGTKITGTAIGGTRFVGSTGTVLECTNSSLTGALFKNKGSGEAVEATIEAANLGGTAVGGDCGLEPVRVTTTAGNGVPWCMKLLGGEAMEVQIRGNSCINPARAITLNLDYTNSGIECKYERSSLAGPIKGVYTTDRAPESTDAIVHIAAGPGSEFKPETGNPFTCFGAFQLETAYTFETDGLTAEPVYFS